MQSGSTHRARRAGGGGEWNRAVSECAVENTARRHQPSPSVSQKVPLNHSAPSSNGRKGPKTNPSPHDPAR